MSDTPEPSILPRFRIELVDKRLALHWIDPIPNYYSTLLFEKLKDAQVINNSLDFLNGAMISWLTVVIDYGCLQFSKAGRFESGPCDDPAVLSRSRESCEECFKAYGKSLLDIPVNQRFLRKPIWDV